MGIYFHDGRAEAADLGALWDYLVGYQADA
jgi:hypothetical protein